VAVGLMASTSLAGISVLTGTNPCDVHAHGGEAVATAAPPCRARVAARLACHGGDAFELGGACACCPWSRSCWYGWGGSRALSMASLAASKLAGRRRWPPLATAARPGADGVSPTDQGWTVFHLPSTPGL